MYDDDYKTVCDSCGVKTWYETEQPCKRTLSKGCEACGSHEYISKEVPCKGTLRIIDTSDLDPRLTRFYRSGERVEVTTADGEKNRFYVGRSTGWKPIYLEIKRINSREGGPAYLPKDAQIRGVGVYK